MNINLLQNILIISIANSCVTVSLIQKTKKVIRKSKYICIYSFIVNMLFGILFCYSFTDTKLPNSLWVGLFSYIGADSLYKSLEGKLKTFTELRNENIKEITYE